MLILGVLLHQSWLIPSRLFLGCLRLGNCLKYGCFTLLHTVADTRRAGLDSSLARATLLHAGKSLVTLLSFKGMLIEWAVVMHA